ncbi:hypothetical protein N8371_03375 [Vicingaceae bacterium]|nr:hypothetical protein [Vicingaceae bacterium]MDB4061397.1 hypothetical protein [Vicingaceae bacterium]MDC1451438.1 hypothetical protein [Vicingaceae bacterium]
MHFTFSLFYSTVLSAQFVTGFANTTYRDRPGSGHTLNFDGVNDYVSILDDDDLSFGDGTNDRVSALTECVG